MSIRVLWSGPEAITQNSERFEVRGTAKALTSLGRLMCAITENTMIKTHGGYGERYPVNMPGLKLILRASPTVMTFGEDAKAFRVEACRERFAILGQSLINSYDDDGLTGYSILVRDIPNQAKALLGPTANQFGFTSVAADIPAEPSGWFGQTSAG